MNEQRLAVLIVNYQRAADTLECLSSLLCITEPKFEIFLVDNGSKADDVTRLQNYVSCYPHRIIFTAFPSNLGFTGAHNKLFEELIPSGRYNYFLLLNNDTVVEPDFLARMLARIDSTHRLEMVAARMMKYENRTCVDNLGITFYKCGLASNRKSLDEPLLGPCGGCALYSTDLLRQIYQATGEYFDEKFFCYAEDTDLAWRAIWLGYRAAWADDALVYHKGSVSSGGPNSDFVLYHGIRNSLFVLVKNIPICLLLKNSGWIVILHSAIILRYIIKHKTKVIFFLYKDFLLFFPVMWNKRSKIIHKKKFILSYINLQVSKNFYDRTYLKSALHELLGSFTPDFIKAKKR